MLSMLCLMILLITFYRKLESFLGFRNLVLDRFNNAVKKDLETRKRI
jgi:hypothetical protein